MIYLCDTHVAMWWSTGDVSLPEPYRDAIDGQRRKKVQVGISVISLWEIAMLAERRRVRFPASVDAFLRDLETDPIFSVLPLSGVIALDGVRLGPRFPRDPADRIIAATARTRGLTLLTADGAIRNSGVVTVL